ncbi:hypothetical protein JCM11251_006172 [Rhodosporidiobolus azoricus]
MPLSSLLPSPSTLFKSLFTTACVLLTTGGTALYLFQNRLIYPSNLPSGSRENVPKPDEFGFDQDCWEEVELRAPDGVRLRAYVVLYKRGGTQPRERPTVLMLHANAGNVGHRLPITKVFWSKMRCNVVALSYRGYGKSEGSPSEKGLKLDSQTALDYILSHPELEKTDVFLYGQSIGGAVAIHLASQNAQRLKGLVIENTFMSLPDLIPQLLPLLTPFLPFLLTQIWPSKTYIASIPSDFPVLFLAGSRDELVEPGQMKGLWGRCKSKRKEWKEFEYGTHNDTCIQPHYFTHIANFISTVTDQPLPEIFTTQPPSTSVDKPVTNRIDTAPPVDTRKEKEADPVSPTKSDAESLSSISSSSRLSNNSGSSSFEFVDRLEGQTEGELLEGKEAITAGSMGLREEAEEVIRGVDEEVNAKIGGKEGRSEEWVKSEL